MTTTTYVAKMFSTKYLRGWAIFVNFPFFLIIAKFCNIQENTELNKITSKRSC